jgi:hypothetical protein
MQKTNATALTMKPAAGRENKYQEQRHQRRPLDDQAVVGGRESGRSPLARTLSPSNAGAAQREQRRNRHETRGDDEDPKLGEQRVSVRKHHEACQQRQAEVGDQPQTSLVRSVRISEERYAHKAINPHLPNT